MLPMDMRRLKLAALPGGLLDGPSPSASVASGCGARRCVIIVLGKWAKQNKNGYFWCLSRRIYARSNIDM